MPILARCAGRRAPARCPSGSPATAASARNRPETASALPHPGGIVSVGRQLVDSHCYVIEVHDRLLVAERGVGLSPRAARRRLDVRLVRPTQLPGALRVLQVFGAQVRARPQHFCVMHTVPYPTLP